MKILIFIKTIQFNINFTKQFKKFKLHRDIDKKRRKKIYSIIKFNKQDFLHRTLINDVFYLFTVLFRLLNFFHIQRSFSNSKKYKNSKILEYI